MFRAREEDGVRITSDRVLLLTKASYFVYKFHLPITHPKLIDPKYLPISSKSNAKQGKMSNKAGASRPVPQLLTYRVEWKETSSIVGIHRMTTLIP